MVKVDEWNKKPKEGEKFIGLFTEQVIKREFIFHCIILRWQ